MREQALGPIVIAGIMLGIGFGGLFDSILFQQILQLHGAISSKVPLESIRNARENLVWSGLFNALYWLSALAGMVALFRVGRKDDVPWSGQALFGSIFVGWGAFMLLEGILAHHVFGAHHLLQNANPASQETGDYAYLVVGLLMLGLGLWAVNSVKSEQEEKLHERRRAAFRVKADEADRRIYLD